MLLSNLVLLIIFVQAIMLNYDQGKSIKISLITSLAMPSVATQGYLPKVFHTQKFSFHNNTQWARIFENQIKNIFKDLSYGKQAEVQPAETHLLYLYQFLFYGYVFVNTFILTDKNTSTFSYVLIKVQPHSDISTTGVFLPVVLLPVYPLQYQQRVYYRVTIPFTISEESLLQSNNPLYNIRREFLIE